MENEKNLNIKSYSRKVEDSELKLLVFYEQRATLNDGLWTLNGFLNHTNFEIREVTFIQGVDRKHDSYHVWYKNKKTV